MQANPREPSLRRNFSWTFIGNVAYSGSQWLIIIILAKLGNPEMVGQFALGLAVTAPIVLFANLSLNSLQVTDARREFAFNEYLGLRLITTACAVVAIIGIVLALDYKRETAYVVLLIGAAKCLDAISDVFLGLLQQRERMHLFARIYIANGLISLAAVSITMAITGDIVLAALSSVFGSFVAMAGFAIPCALMILRADKSSDGRGTGIAELLHPYAILRRMRLLAIRAAPLGITGMLLSLNASVPQFFLQHYYGEHTVGIFAALVYLMIVGRNVSGALAQTTSPRLAIYNSTGRLKKFMYLLRRLFAIAAVLGAVGLLLAITLGRPILTVLYDPEYAEHLVVFVWLMGVMAINYFLSFAGVAVTSMRIFHPQLYLHLINSLVLVFLCWVLIERYALLGAVWAMFISAIGLTLGYVVLTYSGTRRIAAARSA